MQQQFLSWYKGKKVFITGHTGFKGAWLMCCLQRAGAIVKGYALPPDYKNGLYSLLPVSLSNASIFADIRDKIKLQDEILDFHPDFVFHLAAQPLVRKSYSIPAETFEINAIGTANLLEAIIKLTGKCTVIIITTDKVYDNTEQDVLYHENDVLGGYDPYSASKACTEIVVSSYRNSFFNEETYSQHQKALSTARAGNVIGGGDWSSDRIIPDIVRSLAHQQAIDVRNPNAVRPWQHVLEPLSGYLQLGELLDNQPLQFSKPYNFGPLPNDHLTVQQLVETSILHWGSGNWNDSSDPDQLHEAGLLKLDISRAKNELNWVPKLSAKEAIGWTIDWYKQPMDKQVEFTYEQISNYFAL